jgi:hypothetical protein
MESRGTGLCSPFELLDIAAIAVGLDVESLRLDIKWRFVESATCTSFFTSR